MAGSRDAAGSGHQGIHVLTYRIRREKRHFEQGRAIDRYEDPVRRCPPVCTSSIRWIAARIAGKEAGDCPCYAPEIHEEAL